MVVIERVNKYSNYGYGHRQCAAPYFPMSAAVMTSAQSSWSHKFVMVGEGRLSFGLEGELELPSITARQRVSRQIHLGGSLVVNDPARLDASGCQNVSTCLSMQSWLERQVPP